MKKRLVFCHLFLLIITAIVSTVAFSPTHVSTAYGLTSNYVADFSSGKPSDWVYYDRSESEYANKIVKTADGIKVGHLENNYSVSSSVAGLQSNYYGTVYKIAQSLGNVSDFTLEMSYRVLSGENNTRWIGIMYHTNTDMADRLYGMMMNYRTNGKSAGSKISLTNGSPTFSDFNAVDNAGPSHDGTTYIKLKIVVSGNTASHYANGNLITSYNLSDKTTDTNGGFALVINRCSIEINSLTINATHSKVFKRYSADFTTPSEEVEVYDKSDYVNATAPTAYNDGAISGLKIAHTGNSMTPNNYFGAVYNLTDSAISNIGDFDMTVRFRIVNPVNTARWFGIGFHTQKNAQGNMGGYLLVFRSNGSSHASSFTQNKTFHDDTTTTIETGYAHNGSVYYTVGVKVSAGVVTHYIEGNDTISSTKVAQYNLQSREGTLGTQYRSGGFALLVNQCTVEISSININSYTSSESYATGSYKNANLKYAPTTALCIDEQTDFNSLKSSAKPDHLIFNTNDDLAVIDKNNQVICSLADALNKTSAYSLPVIKINSTTAKDKFIKFIELERNYDISVMSSDKNILTQIRKSSFGKNIRAICDWTTTSLNGVMDWKKVVADTNSSLCHIALIRASDATQECVRYIQSRLKTVWVTTDGNDRFAITKAITTGAFGIVGADLTKSGEAFNLFSENDYNQLRAPVNIAHRGLCHEFAEGSDIAYIQAVSQGATYLEVDVWVTSDGHLVLMHNSTIDATTNGSGTVANMTLAQIQQYKCDVLSTNYNAQLPQAQWGKIWSVDEMFATFASNPEVVYAFEWKTGDTSAVDKLKVLLDKYDNYHQVFTITFKDAMVQKMKQTLPQIPVATLNHKNADEIGYKFMQQNNCYCDTSGYDNAGVYSELMKHRGYMPFYWTLLTQEKIDTAIKAGCFGITNNRANAISHYPVSLSVKDEIEHIATAEQLTQNGYQGYLTSYDGTKTTVNATVLDMRESGGKVEAILTTTFSTTQTTKTQITDAYSGGFTYALFSNPIEFTSNQTVTVTGSNISVNGFNSGSEYPIGTQINGTITANNGYRITQVLINGVTQPITSETQFTVAFTLNQDTTIQVSTELIKYTISVAGNNILVSGFSPGSQHIVGTLITGTITPTSHYEITQVTINGVSQTVTDKTSFTLSLTLNQNTTVVVTTAPVKHSVTVTGNNFTLNGFTSGDLFTYGQSVGGTINANNGYKITSISVNGVSQTVTDDKSFTLSLMATQNHAVVVTTEAVTEPEPTPTPTPPSPPPNASSGGCAGKLNLFFLSLSGLAFIFLFKPKF